MWYNTLFSITDIYCADTSISSSDQRDKTDITDFTHGLDWINKLTPVTYRWDKRAWYHEYVCVLFVVVLLLPSILLSTIG